MSNSIKHSDISSNFSIEAMYDTLVDSINYARGTLSNEEALFLSFILPSGGTILAQKIGFKKPNFIIVVELNETSDASSTYYISHSNVNFVLTKVKRQNATDEEMPGGFRIIDGKERAIGFLGNMKD